MATSKSSKMLPFVLWPLLFLGQVVFAALAAWHLLAQFDFAYPLAYDRLAIDQHIERFAPKNRYRPHFETTDQEQHLALFSEISKAIQSHGEGLSDITYVTDSERKIPLLRKAEVIHLQDVALLIDALYIAGLVGLMLIVIGCVIARYKQLPLPSIKAISLGVIGFVSAIGLPLLLIGPKKVFYWFHVLVFPPDHEWFFYYQDSLMTTLMKAPDLFGFIGALMAVVMMCVWIIEIVIMRVLLKPKSAPIKKAG